MNQWEQKTIACGFCSLRYGTAPWEKIKKGCDACIRDEEAFFSGVISGSRKRRRGAV